LELRLEDERLDGQVKPLTLPQSSEPIRDLGGGEEPASGFQSSMLRKHAEEVRRVIACFILGLVVETAHGRVEVACSGPAGIGLARGVRRGNRHRALVWEKTRSHLTTPLGIPTE